RLFNRENDFVELFKVKAEFTSYMKRNEENELSYAGFIKGLCEKEALLPFTPSAMARVIDYSSRLCEHQHRLLTYFEPITDLVREASFWASQNDRSETMGEDVRQALEEKRLRTNLEEVQSKERIIEGYRFISTSGKKIGQINGLSVIEYGDIEYGFPSRITVRTYQGEHGIVHIDREIDMTGPIHNKGLLILTGYLGGMYAQTRPLTLSASITFEQSYGGVEGDSASAAELYAVLSSLGQIDLKQSIAVTGSVNQYGQIQPIGAVNQKIEGFFDVCCSQGLTGEQGVIIPAANRSELMLREDVIHAVEAGQFHVWAIEDIEDGIEMLTCVKVAPMDDENEYPEGSFHDLVMQGLERLDKNRDDDEDNDDDDDDD
ncbi:MAG: Lon-insertion domain-containing protein, partial [Chloroflexota bacterium]